MKKAHVIPVVIVLVIVGAIIFLTSREQSTFSLRVKKNSDPSVFPLKSGSTGTEVKTLQKALNKEAQKFGLEPIAEDGIFGPDTLTQLVALTGKRSMSHAEYDEYIQSQVSSFWWNEIFQNN